jgi:hypothetical protein
MQLRTQTPNPKNPKRLTVTVELEGVVALPGLATASSGLVVAMALVETTGPLAGGGKTTRLAVL